MKIAIDIDNTICETSLYFKDIAIKYDREYLHKNSKIDFSKMLPRSEEWTSEEFRYYIDNIFNNEVINIPIKDQVSYYINKLKDRGCIITFITTRGEKSDDKSATFTEEYLNKHNIPYDNLIMGVRDKYKYIDGYDFFIDDSVSECEKALSNLNCKVIMMKSVNNAEYQNDKLHIANNWEEIYDYIMED